MVKKRKIAVITGSRAEYGLLYWLMKDIVADPAFELQLIVTGMHLSSEFGLTYRRIETDGFTIAGKIESLLSSDTGVGIAKSVGLGVIGFADLFDQLKPDMVLVLGDRFEILAAAQAALFARIPIAHLYGGEVTAGAYDEAIRHSITKMAHVHFVAHETYRKRVIQLGELPQRVFTVGLLAFEHLKRSEWLNRQALERTLNFTFGKLTFLVTFHPTTLGMDNPETEVMTLLHALDEFPQATIIFTKANADEGGRKINAILQRYVFKHNSRTILFDNLGSQKYLSVMKIANVVIGNSSSGLIEAPALGKPTINMGDREKGRLLAPSVLSCAVDSQEIVKAIKKALSPSFKENLKQGKQFYGRGHVSKKILEVIKAVVLEKSLAKTFYDLSD